MEQTGKLSQGRSTTWWLSVVAMSAALATACNQPRPPELQKGDGPYVSAEEGFRLQPPPGWVQQANSVIPSGKIEQERLVTKYKRAARGPPAFLHVSIVDLPPAKKLADYVTHTVGGKQWKPVSKTEKVDVSGQPATRDGFSGQWDKQTVLKEVVAVQRGERVYFFTGYVPINDNKARAQIRAAVASIVWEKGSGTTTN